MRKNQEEYYCFNETGQCNLPSKIDVSRYKLKGTKPVAFLDSNVCLNIIKLVDYGKKATNCNRHKILRLKEHISKSDMRINGLFGILELCEKEGRFLNDKFRDFKYRLDFFEQIPNKYLNKGIFDFHRDFHLIKDVRDFENADSFYENLSILRMSYCSLLKIRKLALKSTKKNNAESSIDSFTQWMVDDLGLMLGIEYKLAMSVFGGRTEFRKMIGLDDNSSSAIKKIKGTVWDIFHSRYCMHNANISKHLGEDLSAYFVTNDFNLFNLLHRYSLTGIIDPGDDSGSTSWYNTDFDYPHLDNEFLERYTEKVLKLMYERSKVNFEYDKEKINRMILTLEKENGL